jgi:hypothetical protein
LGTLSRREFIKLSGISLAALACRLPGNEQVRGLPELSGCSMGRIARNNEPVYSQPDLASKRLRILGRDELVSLLEEVESPYGPEHNQRWYRLEQGYLHSGNVQRVAYSTNLPLKSIPSTGILGQVTVPYTRTSYKTRQGSWMQLYRLYYGTVHWITALEEGASGELLYRLTDELLRVHYRVPAEHLRPLPESFYAPFQDDTDPQEKYLKVSLERQTVTAIQNRTIVREMAASTGRRYTPTYPGEFYVDRKHPSKHMGDGGITSNLHAYELVGVPWTSFFQTNGIAFHGTFWHDNFGTPTSKGCVNLRNEDALWVFRWTTPSYRAEFDDRPTWRITARDGTRVIVS